MAPNKDKDNKGNPLRKYLALTGIAFEMGAIIFVFAYIGKKLDAYYQFEKNWCTLICILVGLILSLYLVIKQLNNLNKQ